MQASVSSAGDADSHALLLILKHQLDSRRVVRHFVCSECLAMIAAVQGRDYLHTCDVDTTPTCARSLPVASTAVAADLALLREVPDVRNRIQQPTKKSKRSARG